MAALLVPHSIAKGAFHGEKYINNNLPFNIMQAECHHLELVVARDIEGSPARVFVPADKLRDFFRSTLRLLK